MKTKKYLQLKNPQNLLEACMIAKNVRGGTIHEYLPRLAWTSDKYYSADHSKTALYCYYLRLDNTDIVGYFSSTSEVLTMPEIMPVMDQRVKFTRWPYPVKELPDNLLWRETEYKQIQLNLKQGAECGIKSRLMQN